MEWGEGKFEVDRIIGSGGLNSVCFEDGVLGLGQYYIIRMGRAELVYELTIERTLHDC